MKKLAQLGIFALSLIFFALPQDVMAQDSSNIDLEKLQSAESALELLLLDMEMEGKESPEVENINATIMSPTVQMTEEKRLVCQNITYRSERRLFIGRKTLEGQNNNGDLSAVSYNAQLERIQKAEDQLIAFREVAGL